MLTLVFLLSCFVNKFYLILCTLIGAIMLIINIQVGLHIYICVNFMHIYVSASFTIGPSFFFETTSGMHRRPFEGRHLAVFVIYIFTFLFL